MSSPWERRSKTSRGARGPGSLRRRDGAGVAGHGGHGEGGAGGDGRTAGVADREVLGAHPGGEFVAFADGERDRDGADEGVGVLSAGLDAEGLRRGVVDGGIGGGGAVDDAQLIDGCLVDGGGAVGGDGDQTKGKGAHECPSWKFRIAAYFTSTIIRSDSWVPRGGSRDRRGSSSCGAKMFQFSAGPASIARPHARLSE